MLELLAFDRFTHIVTPLLARRQLVQPLDVDQARALKQLPFLSCVFLNGRMQDSSGEVRPVAWEGERDAVVLSPEALDALVQKFTRYAQAIESAGARFSPLEQALWRFVQDCQADRLTVVSRSSLVLFETE
jgi:hypothetical protein